MPTLRRDYREFMEQTDRLIDLLHHVGNLEPYYRKLISDIILIRLFFSMENTVKSVFSKIACGALYLDGSAPQLLHQERSARSAVYAMENLSRRKPRRLRWTEGSEIRKNVQHVIDSADHCCQIVTIYASFITEIRIVRNHVAHRNDSTRRRFRNVVRRHYGGFRRGVNTGTLLTSTRINDPPLIEAYVHGSRALMKDLTKA